MLSRALPPPAARPPLWDVFCTVVDNFGDIGVCWRLARQLVVEHGLRVRLWVDDLHAFERLCPTIDGTHPVQQVAGVEIHRWSTEFPETEPGDAVIEAFGCPLPEIFVNAMATGRPQPFWINLEYLSAEPWVGGCHALPSPHPRLPITKYFFFPGFTQDTGGLLRERDLLRRRSEFLDAPLARAKFWRTLGFSPPPPGTLSISLFSYENAAIGDLLHHWENGDRPVCCMVPVSRALVSVEAYCGTKFLLGQTVRRKQLEIRVLPFVEQTRYDPLLWACDLNFVRGEDSFVRAQWAARPFVWHIYPQEADAHLVKLDAFLDRYCMQLPPDGQRIVRNFWHGWNAGAIQPAHWRAFASLLPVLAKHAGDWSGQLAKQPDLASQLVRFFKKNV